MALISTSTFDPLARYVNVRMQQGVPIVDADINELDDIRQFELRAFLKWFVGDGVPDGNDGFRIEGTGAADDFTIKAGDQAGTAGAAPDERGLRNVGRIIADGLDVIIDADISFTKQPLHESNPGAQQLADRLGVDIVTALPRGSSPVAVYLDVWETVVTADDRPELLHAGVGVETCARIRRDWVVRVRQGDGAPQPGDDGYLPRHSYTLLAVITRRGDDPQVRASDVTDHRHRRLQLPPATLVEDVMGTSADDYRAGSHRPPISLREAVNALLRGELPMTPDARVTAAQEANATDAMSRAFLLDSQRGLVAVFSKVLTNTEQVYLTRMGLDATSAGFVTPIPLTSGVSHTRPSVAELPDGSLFIVYQSENAAGADIHCIRGTFSQLASNRPPAPSPVAATSAPVGEDSPFVVATGQVVTVFFHKSIPGDPNTPAVERWFYRRWSLASGWVDTDAKQLADIDTKRRDFHAAADSTGKIWAVINATGASGGFYVVNLDPAGGGEPTRTKIGDAPTGGTAPPFVLCPRSGGAWVFWQADGIFVNRIDAAPSQVNTVKIDGTDLNDREPCAIEDGDGALWLIWSRGEIGNRDLLARRRDNLGQWGIPHRVVTSDRDDTAPFAVAGSDTTVWLFWGSDRDGTFRIYYKRLVTAI